MRTAFLIILGLFFVLSVIDAIASVYRLISQRHHRMALETAMREHRATEMLSTRTYTRRIPPRL